MDVSLFVNQWMLLNCVVKCWILKELRGSTHKYNNNELFYPSLSLLLQHLFWRFTKQILQLLVITLMILSQRAICISGIHQYKKLTIFSLGSEFWFFFLLNLHSKLSFGCFIFRQAFVRSKHVQNLVTTCLVFSMNLLFWPCRLFWKKNRSLS